MEERSSDKHPNLLTPEERRLQSTQSTEVSQRSYSSPSEHRSSLCKGKQINTSSLSTHIAIQSPSIIAASSSRHHSSETRNIVDSSSKKQDHTPFTSRNQRIERESSTAYPDLFTLLEKYKDDSTLLKFSLSKKIEEDRRKTEEAKFKHTYLDYLLSLDLTDNISSSSSKTTASVVTAEKPVFSFCNPFSPESSSSGIRRDHSSVTCCDDSNNSLMTNWKRGKRHNIQIPAFNLEYINTESTPQRSDTGETLKSSYHQSITQLYSPYEIQNKRSRATEEPSTSRYQTTRKEISCNKQQISLYRKNSDPICPGVRSISKVQSSPDVSASYLKIPRFSRHLSVPDLQHPSNTSSALNTKDLTSLLLPIPANLTSTIGRSASPSTSSESSAQPSVYSNKKIYESAEDGEYQKSFDFEMDRQTPINQIEQDDEQEEGQSSTLIHKKKERMLLPDFKVSKDSQHMLYTPNQSKNQLLSLTSTESKEGRSSSDYSKLKGKKREMHAISMIVETTEFPYQDYYSWKNNGNTIHKSTGQKSIYYKCSNCIEGCPVNKTVAFKENGGYLIKYRGRHIDKCNKEKSRRIPS